MDRTAVEQELPVAVRRWHERHSSDATWYEIGLDCAVTVAAALLIRNGAAGIDLELFQRLCDDPSPAVRALAGSAEFPRRRFRAKTVAIRVAHHFQVSAWVLYEMLRRRTRRKSSEQTTFRPREDSG